MQLIFDNAEVMSLSHTLQYVGDFNFRNEQAIDIQGVILDNNYSGVEPIWSSMSGMIAAVNDYSEIIVQGFSLGSGTLQSLTFDGDGPDVRQKRYSASILINKSGNLFNLTGTYYSGLSGLQNLRPDLVESFSESFDFSSDDKEVYGYNRNFDIKVLSGIGVNPSVIAKSWAGVIFSGAINLPFIQALYPTFYLQSGKKLHQESYDLINGEFNFSESFRFQDNDPFVWTFTHSAQFGEDGSQVSEKGLFEGVDINNYDTARQAYISNIGGAYNRCNNVYQTYIGTGCTLINSIVSQNITANKFGGTVEYDVIFSDRKDNLTGCFWEKSFDFVRNRDGYYTVSENGNVQGRGPKTYNPNAQYISAQTCFSGIYSGVYDRLTGLFLNNSGFLADCAGNLFLSEETYTDSEYNGAIDYNLTYTTNSGYNTSGAIFFTGNTLTDSQPVPLKASFGILNYKEIVTPVYRGNSSLGSLSNSINVFGSGTENSIQNLINSATSLIILPSGTDIHLEDVSYIFDPKAQNLNLSVSYNYVNYRSLLNIIV